jgi:hypothetical protein
VLGLIFHYVLTQGVNPFKHYSNISNGKPVLKLQSFLEAVPLISKLLNTNPNIKYQYIIFISNLRKFM